jgi:methylmalonyl-CoA mutase C-terminal domain/subunit
MRVLVIKSGLDGHDGAAKVIPRALRDADMEVIYAGLRQTPEMIVTALQEDVRAIGLSVLSGAPMAIVPRVMELLAEKEMNDVPVIVGGITPVEFICRAVPAAAAWILRKPSSSESISNSPAPG